MIKTVTTLLIFIFLFSACAERGSTLIPKRVIQKPLQTTTPVPQPKTEKVNKTVKPQAKKPKTNSETSQNTTHPEKVEKILLPTSKKTLPATTDDTLFSLSESTKHKLSGIFIFIIGLMIFI